jgi:hypothetical protein
LARHLRTVDRRDRGARIGTVAVVWLAGLTAGFYGLLAATARYGCSSADHALACGTPGSLLGVLVVVVVIAVVTAVTVLAFGRGDRAVVWFGATGLAALALCFAGARMLLSTV